MRHLVLALSLCVALAVPAAARPLSDAELDEVRQFAVGNVVWVLYHEIGHFLVNDFELPILGREEDAVDNLATVLLLEDRSAIRDSFLIAAVDAFFLLGESARSEALFEGHGLDEQRAFQVACLMYGSDPAAFGPFANTVGLPQSRRETCPYEYTRTRKSWFSVLTPHRSTYWSTSYMTVIVDYADTEDPRNAGIAKVLYDAQVLEVAADYLSRNFVLRTQPTLQVRACNQPNAFYEPATRSVVVCYELYDSFRQLLEQHLSSQ